MHSKSEQIRVCFQQCPLAAQLCVESACQRRFARLSDVLQITLLQQFRLAGQRRAVEYQLGRGMEVWLAAGPHSAVECTVLSPLFFL